MTKMVKKVLIIGGSVTILCVGLAVFIVEALSPGDGIASGAVLGWAGIVITGALALASWIGEEYSD